MWVKCLYHESHISESFKKLQNYLNSRNQWIHSKDSKPPSECPQRSSREQDWRSFMTSLLKEAMQRCHLWSWTRSHLVITINFGTPFMQGQPLQYTQWEQNLMQLLFSIKGTHHLLTADSVPKPIKGLSLIKLLICILKIYREIQVWLEVHLWWVER